MTRFHVLFNSISGRWECDNRRLCATETHVEPERFSPPVGLEHGTARAAGQLLNYRAVGATPNEIGVTLTATKF